MTSAADRGSIAGRIATINAGGGTEIYPAMTAAGEALSGVKAKVRHMIVLTDGQTGGSGYPELAAQLHNQGVTISTVGIGQGFHGQLLQTIAAAGGGKFYETLDPTNLPRIFTQDAMVHMGKLIREESFKPKQIERHLMLSGLPVDHAPTLMGYVKTQRKATAAVPLVTDMDDPLLAHWQFGLGKVTAFASDAKSRWAAPWITGWPGYAQFWAQVLRETAHKPQSRFMDVRLAEAGDERLIHADLLEDPAHFKNDATVAATIRAAGWPVTVPPRPVRKAGRCATPINDLSGVNQHDERGEHAAPHEQRGHIEVLQSLVGIAVDQRAAGGFESVERVGRAGHADVDRPEGHRLQQQPADEVARAAQRALNDAAEEQAGDQDGQVDEDGDGRGLHHELAACRVASGGTNSRS